MNEWKRHKFLLLFSGARTRDSCVHTLVAEWIAWLPCTQESRVLAPLKRSRNLCLFHSFIIPLSLFNRFCELSVILFKNTTLLNKFVPKDGFIFSLYNRINHQSWFIVSASISFDLLLCISSCWVRFENGNLTKNAMVYIVIPFIFKIFRSLWTMTNHNYNLRILSPKELLELSNLHTFVEFIDDTSMLHTHV